MSIPFSENAWIGLIRNADCQSGWIWEESKACLDSKIGSIAWAKGEPNNSGGKENCVEYHTGKSNKWNDEQCEKKRCALCQNFYDEDSE